MADNIQTIPAEQLCTLTGLSDRRHRQLAKDGYFPSPINGQYQLTLTLQGMFRYYREQQNKGNDEFAMERIRKTRTEANLAEIRLAKERKDALDRKSVLETWENVVMVIRQRLLSLPSKLSPRLVFIDGQGEIEKELDREIVEALSDLSKPITYKLSEDDASEEIIQEGAEPSAEASEASTETERS